MPTPVEERTQSLRSGPTSRFRQTARCGLQLSFDLTKFYSDIVLVFNRISQLGQSFDQIFKRSGERRQ
jgi:hypothetical protein